MHRIRILQELAQRKQRKPYNYSQSNSTANANVNANGNINDNTNNNDIVRRTAIKTVTNSIDPDIDVVDVEADIHADTNENNIVLNGVEEVD
jgi:hypothetical protein